MSDPSGTLWPEGKEAPMEGLAERYRRRADASPQDRLLGLLGRDPAWRAPMA